MKRINGLQLAVQGALTLSCPRATVLISCSLIVIAYHPAKVGGGGGGGGGRLNYTTTVLYWCWFQSSYR